MSKKFQYILDFVAQTEKFQKEVGGLKGTLKSVGVAAAAYFSVDAILDFGKAAVSAYNDSAQAEAALLTALKGRSDIQGRLIEQAGQLQGKTLFEDDETIRAQSLVAAFIKEENAIRSIIPVIQDFAAAKQMDLAGAADLVTKTIAGEMNALGRYGIQVEGAAGSAERLASVQKGLNDAFGGQAVAAAKAGVGALTMLKNSYGDLLETIGGGGSETINENARFITALVNMINGKLKDGLAERETDEQATNKRLKESSVEQLQGAVKMKMDAADLYLKYYKQAVDEENKAEREKWSIKYSAAKQSIDQINKEIELRKGAEKAQNSETGSVAGLAEQLKALNEIAGATNASDTKSLQVTYAKIAAIEQQVASLDRLKKATALMVEDTASGFRSEAFMQITPITNAQVSGSDKAFDTKAKLDITDMQKNMPVYIAAQEEMRAQMDATAEKQQAIQGAFQTGFANIGQSVVDGLGLAENGMEGFLGKLAETAIQLISMMLAQSLANAIFGATTSGAATGPAAIFTTPAFIATAIAGVAGAFAAIAFADGGIVSGPTHALVGEYPGARSNPEVIAPLSKLKAMIGAGSGDPVILQASLELGYDSLRVRLNRVTNNTRKRNGK